MAGSKPLEDWDIVSAAFKDVYRDCERKDWSPFKLPQPHVICWFVEQAHGKIGNGGLQYFFEGNWPDKPPYEKFIDAFNSIGSIEAGACLARAVALFPFPEPHLFVVRRNKFMDECRERDGQWNTEFDRLGNRIMDLEPESDARLAAYIRTHIDFFPTAKALIFV
jgi:hypothetical protein